jgi:hypothetical protein
MIDPIDELPIDDADHSGNEDQPSQQDIHSNGFDDAYEDVVADKIPETDQLQQASDASEPSFTLDED